MEIILLKDIEKVGEKHEIVTVKDGYARNFLIPTKQAIIANVANKAKLADLIAKAEAEEAGLIADLQAQASKMAAANLRIGAKAGTSGKIFGSVTSIQIAEELANQLEITVDRKLIELPEDIKEVGNYKATVKLHKKVVAELPFEVVAE